MDQESGKQLIGYIKKYPYILLVALVGVFLMLVPQKQEEPQMQAVSYSEMPAAPDLETELAEILGKISGVGKAEVLLTEASGADTIYQTESTQSHWDTVTILGTNREEQGLVKQVLPPVYRGAIVVCRGGDNAGVRLKVVEAVKSVTGLSSDCITVLKMK